MPKSHFFSQRSWLLAAVCAVVVVFAPGSVRSASAQGGGDGSDGDAKPDQRPAAVAQNFDGEGTLIVLNKSGASAALISRATGLEIARLPVGDGPHEVDVSPDGRIAVVGNYGQWQAGHTLTVLDLPARKVVKTIDLEKYHRPHGIVFMPDGKRVVVTAEQEQKLLVVNIETGAVEHAVDTDSRVSHMVALSPDAKRAFVANIGSHSLTVVDLEKGERIKNIPTGRGAEGVDVSPDGTEVWVSNRANNTVTVIDADTLEVLDNVDSPAFPIRVKFTRDGSKVLVSNARSGDVTVFDAATRKEIKRIAMDEEALKDSDGRLFGDQFGNSPVPIGIYVTPDDRYAYIANTNADIVTVIDLKELAIVGRIAVGPEPDGLGFTPLVIEAEPDKETVATEG